MMKYILIFGLLASSYGKCPTPEIIRKTTNFQNIVIQYPFEQYPGIPVYNGVEYQNKGICSNGAECFVPANNCSAHDKCLPLTQELLFNLVPTNLSKILKKNDIVKAVKTARNITYIDAFRPSPYIPNILCQYEVSDLINNYSCLPKFCETTGEVCLKTNSTCECIPKPCDLYYAIKI